MRHPIAAAAVLCTAFLIAGAAPGSAGGQRSLTDLERQIAQDHPNVRALTAEQFEARLSQGADVVVFDVRERNEYAVSRLPGAILVDPDTTAEDFMRRHAASLAGKTVLLYCSVGVRSSILAARIDGAVRNAGATGAYNLRGGIFSWHNTGRQLVDTKGETDKVDGYNRTWARYVDFDNLVRLTRGWFW
jgi:rhodanese-related sulfurtransferase